MVTAEITIINPPEKSTYLNRYSDKVTFKRIGLLKFEVTGFISSGLRQLRDTTAENLVSIDPSGGPRITAKWEGVDPTDMGEFNKKWKGMKVVSIGFDINEFTKIIIECEYILDKVKWKMIKNPA